MPLTVVVQGEALLLTIAQVSVTLAGFSSLVIAIRSTPASDWHPRDTWSLSWMLGTSLGALFLALFPLLLVSFDFREAVIWQTADLMAGAYMIIFAAVMILSGRRLTKLGHRPRVHFFPPAASMLLLLCGIFCWIAGLMGRGAFGFFILGLIACLFVSALSVVVFLTVLARTAAPKS